MSVTFRHETPKDYRAVENLNREAFWGYTGPTCDEHYLVHILRDRSCFMPELTWIADADGEMAGYILFTRAKVVSADGTEHPVLTFGPLAVHPGHRNRGVGQALMRHAFAVAREGGHGAVIIFGHPDYYPRVGFRRAGEFGIATHDGATFDAFMALELYDGALEGITGKFYEDPAFESMKPEDIAAFDASFPPKEPAALPPIGPLLNRLPEAARESLRAKKFSCIPELVRVSGREVAALDGMDAAAMDTINAALAECGYPPKIGYTFEE